MEIETEEGIIAAALQTAGEREALALKTQGQRRINTIWEHTQAFVAVSVTSAALTACMFMIWNGSEGKVDKAFQLLGNTLMVVIGFYFGRTNHQRIGGVGGGTQDVGR